MARHEEVLSVFIASPGDVIDERDRLSEVVHRWNTTWGRNEGLRLELLRWEYDAYPGLGIDAQDVINKQIPQDYDLFVGLMWTRFGTPTGRAGSGTEEEFSRALERYRQDPKSVNILFYFKDAPISPSKIDAEQLNSVASFKSRIRSIGLLTWDFQDANDFEKLVELHITRYIQERKKKITQETNLKENYGNESHIKIEKSAEINIEQDDYGYIDSIDDFSNEAEKISEIVKRFTIAQTELAEEISSNTSEMEEMRTGTIDISPKTFKEKINRAAEQMQKFTNRVNDDIPAFHSAMERGMNALVRVITITPDLYPEKVQPTKDSVIELLENLISARKSIEEFRDTTSSLPRLTKELNASKRKQVETLNKFIAEIENGELLLKQSLKVIDSISDHSN